MKFTAFQNISKEIWCTRAKSHQNPTKHSGIQINTLFILRAVITPKIMTALNLFKRLFDVVVIQG